MEYSIVTYNIGSCSKYNSSFYNLYGQIGLISKINPDFVLLQEVTKGSFVNKYINPYKKMSKFLDYKMVYTADVNIPFVINHGQATLSKYDMSSSIFKTRHVLGVFVKSMFLSNRNTIVSKVLLGNRELVLFNVHFIAYSRYKSIRDNQFNDILSLALNEVSKGNCVIIGGDFNMDLTGLVVDGFKVCCPDSFTYKNEILDGFIVSNDIDMSGIEVFSDRYSDHYLVKATFKIV